LDVTGLGAALNDEANERIRALELENAALRAGLTQQRPSPLAVSASPPEAPLTERERAAHAGSWAWDLATGEVRWSDELYRIFGYDPATTKASSEAFFAAVHPDDRARVQLAAERALRGNATETDAFRVVRPDGSVRQVHLEGAGLLGANGEKSHLVGAVFDLTDTIRSASLLSQTVDELRTAQRMALMGSYTLDVASMRADWSLGLFELLQVDLSELPTAELFFQHVHPDDRVRGRATLAEIIHSGIGAAIELRMVRKDGSVWHALADSVPECVGNKLILHGIVQDVTRRKAEEERLRHAEKMVAVGTLAGGIAHDFNNYLTVLMGESELLRMTLPREHRGLRSLDAIEDAATRCAKLTSQLLTLGRKRSSQTECFDLSKLVARLSPMFRSVLGERNEVIIKTDGSELFVRADPTELENALINLAVNARDALTASGRFTVNAQRVYPDRTLQGRGDHALAQLLVSDTGAGIEQDLLPRVFEPFFTTKAFGKGAGLGLATVYSVVQRAGGQVEVQSEVGRGTTFRLCLPLADEPDSACVVAEPKEPPLSTGGKTILVVEDLPELRAVLREQLLVAGYRVLLAEHGRAALELLASSAEPIDAVLSDVIMPVLGGFELQTILQQRYPHIRCALMTGYSESEPDERQRVIALRKPFSRPELLAAVAALWEESSEPSGASNGRGTSRVVD
jgi:PAS domain S-box-containing protein